MANKELKGDISDKIRKGFDKARLKFLEEEAENNGVIIISDKNGNIKEVPAKDLLLEAQKKK